MRHVLAVLTLLSSLALATPHHALAAGPRGKGRVGAPKYRLSKQETRALTYLTRQALIRGDLQGPQSTDVVVRAPVIGVIQAVSQKGHHLSAVFNGLPGVPAARVKGARALRTFLTHMLAQPKDPTWNAPGKIAARIFVDFAAGMDPREATITIR